MMSWWRSIRRYDVRDVLPLITAPTLVVDHADRVTPVQHGRYLAAHLPNAERVELPDGDSPYRWVATGASAATSEAKAATDPLEPLDRSMLDDLEQLEADTGTPLIDELIAEWKASAARAAVGVDTAIRAGDLDQVRRLAHELTGCSGTVAAAAAVAACRSLEEAAKKGDLSAVRQERRRVDSELHRASKALARCQRTQRSPERTGLSGPQAPPENHRAVARGEGPS